MCSTPAPPPLPALHGVQSCDDSAAACATPPPPAAIRAMIARPSSAPDQALRFEMRIASLLFFITSHTPSCACAQLPWRPPRADGEAIMAGGSIGLAALHHRGYRDAVWKSLPLALRRLGCDARHSASHAIMRNVLA